ncbi:hypothetical protein RIF29_17144 [Crotalaria pallida]|uniref:Uncharacterized protein n=1 Tax=Crotalaria pallida TaxID=3830 RepID=A0AAN9FGS2_CROPI
MNKYEIFFSPNVPSTRIINELEQAMSIKAVESHGNYLGLPNQKPRFLALFVIESENISPSNFFLIKGQWAFNNKRLSVYQTLCNVVAVNVDAVIKDTKPQGPIPSWKKPIGYHAKANFDAFVKEGAAHHIQDDLEPVIAYIGMRSSLGN